jgi:deubiquitinase DESI2
MGGSFGGGRTRMGTPVLLNVYDLSPANDTVLYALGLGLHHSGVEVDGTEYSFASGAGVFEMSTPREVPGGGARYRETVQLGLWEGSRSEFQTALSDVRRDFGPNDYHLIRRNCNHFANAFVWRLLGRKIPAHINRLADIGVCCSCLLPKEWLEHAPVGDPSRSASSSGTRRSNDNNTTTTTFKGSGIRLGSVKPEPKGIAARLLSSDRSPSPRTEDLTDRRERVRKATLARFELQKQEN